MTLTSPVGIASLEDKIAQHGGAVDMLRANPQSAFVFPVVPQEYTNWQDEQRAARETVALNDMSHHMNELHLRGRDVIRFLSRYAVNNFANFTVSRAKQLIVIAPDGRLIGDAIAFREDNEFVRIVGAPTALDWLHFQSQQKTFAVESTVELNSAVVPGPRDVFRIQIQGPNTMDLWNEVVEGPVPDIKFFCVGEVTIAGRPVRALRHTMSGHAGFEIFGPWESKQAVLDRLVAAGENHGLVLVGMRGGPTLTLEGGWLASPLPAIYDGDATKGFRQWLTAANFESFASLGGSFGSRDIGDYYVDPFEAGYGHVIDFSRDFLGRDALLERQRSQTRRKVTLVWDTEDVLSVIRSVLTGERPGRMPEIPFTSFAAFIADRVEVGGRLVGLSRNQYGYSTNVKAFISLATIDVTQAEPGTQVDLMWGEADELNPTTPSHEIHRIGAVVAPSPYYEYYNKTRA